MPRHFSLIFMAALIWGAAASVWSPPVAAQPVELRQDRDAPESPPIRRDGSSLRLGLLLNALADAPETGPLFYFDLALQHRQGEYYFDLRAPALMILVDGAIALVRLLLSPDALPLFITMNGEDVPGHWELGHARLGYRFRLVPPDDWEGLQNSYNAAVGLLGTADIVGFETRRDLDAAQAVDAGYPDPFVVGAGGFFMVGREQELVSYDLSLGGGLGRSAFGRIGAGPVYFFTADADIRYELEFRGSVYLRPRLTAYLTEMDPALHLTMGLTTGLSLRF